MEQKWKLPSREGWGGEVWTVRDGSKLDRVITRAVQAESDLTEALGLLERAFNIIDSDEYGVTYDLLNSFLTRFR
jgi:hypothetical protein